MINTCHWPRTSKKVLGVAKLDTALLQNPKSDDLMVRKQAGLLYKMLTAQGYSEADDVKNELKSALQELKARAEYAYNPEFKARQIVGDNPDDTSDTKYGNADVTGP